MSRITDILTRAKDTLAPNGRWEDARLLRALDEAQKAICLRTGILRGYSLIPLLQNQATYVLPNLGHRISRVLFSNELIPVYSHDQMDKIYGYDWEKHVGTKTLAIVFTLNNSSSFRVYPVPVADTVALIETDGVTADSEDYTLDSPFGVLTDIESDTSPIETGEVLSVYYTKQPATLTSETDDLEISSAFDAALKFYVTAAALKDNQDTQSRALAIDELQLFDSELRQIVRDSTLDSMNNATVFSTPYVGAFDG